MLLYLLLVVPGALAQLLVQSFGLAESQQVDAMPLQQHRVRTQNDLPLIPRDLTQDQFDSAIPVTNDQSFDVPLRPGQSAVYRYDFSTSNTSYISLYYLTANVQEYPKNISRILDDEHLDEHFGIYVYVNQTHVATNELFDEGYTSDIIYYSNDYAELQGSLYIEPYFKGNNSDFTDSDYVKYSIALSLDTMLYQWDNGTLAGLVDTDDDSVYFQSEAYSISSQTLYKIINETGFLQLQVFDQVGFDDVAGLMKSWAAITSAETVIPRDQIELSYSNYSGEYKLQMYVEGLESSTVYYAILTYGQGTKLSNGVVYSYLKFTTQAAGSCELIYDLEFCSDVAYAVPQSSDFEATKDKRELKILYDAYAASIYENFTLAMQQIACDAELESRYSPVVTCDDCLRSYKEWLCSVTIPRCSTSPSTYFQHRKVGEMRTEVLASRVNPPSAYYEVMPCIDMCYAIARDCPSDFGFSCPGNSTMVEMSYNYFFSNVSYDTCNVVGSIVPASVSSGTGRLAVNYKVLWMLMPLSFILMV